MGNLLVQINGKDATDIKVTYAAAVIWLVIGIILFIGANVAFSGMRDPSELGMFVAPSDRRQYTFFYDIMSISRWIIGIGTLCAIPYALYWKSFYEKMEISAFEQGIKGTASTKKIGEKEASVSSFTLMYDQVSSVDITNEFRVVVNSNGREYTVHTTQEKAKQVVGLINSKLHKVR